MRDWPIQEEEEAAVRNERSKLLMVHFAVPTTAQFGEVCSNEVCVD